MKDSKNGLKCFKETFDSTFFDYLSLNLQKFMQHNFVAR